MDKEFLVLLGPSGCGKTTTMRMVAGLEEATSGDIYIDADRINGVLPKYRDVAMVFQSYALYPHLTVEDNIGYPLKIRKVPPAERKRQIAEVARRVELDSMLSRLPKELSGGQRQRVALARAIVRTPRVFLMDEPLSNLDAKLRTQMRAELKHLQHELQVTTIYVTHDQIEAMTLAHRVAVMNKGVIEQLGTPREIYNDPRTLFVAGFIGSPPMNLDSGGSDERRVHQRRLQDRRAWPGQRSARRPRCPSGGRPSRGPKPRMPTSIWSRRSIRSSSPARARFVSVCGWRSAC